ncbi:MAG: hypothetical protein ACK458_04455 [Sphingobacteriales bacterium]
MQGYIGQRLIQVMLQGTHQLYCCVRNKQRFEAEHQNPSMWWKWIFWSQVKLYYPKILMLHFTSSTR